MRPHNPRLRIRCLRVGEISGASPQAERFGEQLGRRVRLPGRHSLAGLTGKSQEAVHVDLLRLDRDAVAGRMKLD